MNLESTIPLPGTLEDPLYPDSDGRPMGETDFHTIAQRWLVDGLQDFFADWPDLYVAMNILLYYLKGQPNKRRDPDVLVAKGVGKHRRRSYRLWEEKVLPCTLFEIASKKTWRVDVGPKRRLYARIGIREYIIFDPEARYLNPPLQGFRLVKGKSVAMKGGRDGNLTSKELGLRLVPEGSMLRLIDVRTGLLVPTRVERDEQRRTQIAQAENRARELAAEVQRLRAQLGLGVNS